MSWLDKLMSGHGKRTETAKDNALDLYTEKLKTIVYDEDIVKELAPVFAKLHGTDGFDKVFELIETKEQQITAISGGDWHEQQINDHQNLENELGEEEADTLSAEEILAKKYETK